MRSIAATAASICVLLTHGCASDTQMPPSAVTVKVGVPIPCREPEPACQAPAYNGATKDQPIDARAALLRAEAIEQADCLRLYKEALARCRSPVDTP